MTSSIGLPIVAPQELLAALGERDLRVIDCRWSLTDPDHGEREYRRGHVLGAVWLSIDTDLAATAGPGRHPLPSTADFAETLGRSGVGNRDTVVAYDDAGGTHAARLWWMLRSLGHERSGVLDGGWQAWLGIDGPVTTQDQVPEPTTYSAPTRWAGVIGREEVAARLGSVSLVDSRPPERYRGETEPIDQVAGHIPTARNLPATDNLDDALRFRPPAELRSRFDGLDRPVVYCGSGVNACHNALAMHVAGIEAILYPGSWSDWSTAGGPVATGAEPGSPPR